MKVFRHVAEWRAFRPSVTEPVGFVPTMGALHDGHLALVERSLGRDRMTVVSVFVNPTQFDRPTDLETYPADTERDLELLDARGVDAVLLPRGAEIYPDGYRYRVRESSLASQLCGAHRPGHFDGVLTVVMRLLNIVRPRRAYFGEKDYQQLQLVRGMLEAFFMDVDIVACPTVREPDGLALSSRNRHLSAAQRRVAPLLYRVIRESDSAVSARQRLIRHGFKVDYVEDRGDRRFAAAWLGEVRLIDNVALERRDGQAA